MTLDHLKVLSKPNYSMILF